MRASPSACSAATASGARRSAATGSGPICASVAPGGAIRAATPVRGARRRRRAAALPAALLRARAGGAALLVDGVAGVPPLRSGAGEARQRPGRAERVGEAEREAEPEVGGARLDLGREPRLAAEQMRAAGDVERQRLRRLGGDPGAEALGPAAQRAEEGPGAQRILGAGDRLGQIARASASAMPRRRPAASAAAERLASASAPRTSAVTASGASASSGAWRSTRSASSRGNQIDRTRRGGMAAIRLFLYVLILAHRRGSRVPGFAAGPLAAFRAFRRPVFEDGRSHALIRALLSAEASTK